nr:MAG TPA: hypothetical protein [Caudoviricetes sp.]
MSKKLKIQFWKAEQVLAMQILEQEGLPRYKEKGYHNRIGEISPINIVFSEEERKEFLTEVRDKVKERIFSIVDNLSESEYSNLYDFLKMFIDIAIGKRG